MKNKVINLLLFSFLFAFNFSFSQIDDNGDLPPTDDPDPPVASIDSLVYFVMIIGLVYVFRIFILKRKINNL